MAADFAHLHVHSEYSLLDGQSHIDRLIAATQAGGMDALALTDHGGMYGTIEFYKACKAAGIKPIIGCLLAGQEIITADGVKKIEEIQVGDRVLTHKGRFRRVVRTMQRHYIGQGYVISLAGNCQRTLTLTEEHPLLIRTRDGAITWKRPAEISPGRHCRKGGVNCWNSWVCLPRLRTEWAEIDVLDYLPHDFAARSVGGVERVYTSKYRANEIWPTSRTKLMLDYDLGYLLGIYAAEGSLLIQGERVVGGITFTLHLSETEVAERILCLLAQLGVPGKIYRRIEHKSLEIVANNLPLAYLLRALCGHGARRKRVPLQVLNGPTEVRRGFLEGLLDGDGKSLKRPSNTKGGQDLKTASRSLAWGTRALLADFGYWANVSEGDAVSTLLNGRTSGICHWYMVSYSPQRSYARTLQDEQHLFHPIRSIEPLMLNTEVFNIEVEEDNSYVSDFVLHNCEGYLAPSIEEKTGRYEYNHLLLLAKNRVGYHNLLKLTTIAHTRGYHYRPRVDKRVLAEHAEGLIVTSGCLSGEIPELLLKGDLNGARAAARWYREAFGPDNFYIEIQDHNAPESEQNRLNPLLYELAHETDTPLLATNDLHYVAAADADAQDVLLCVQTGKTLDEPKRMKFDSQEYYLKTPEEMARLFPELPEALANTVRVAEQCEVEIDFGGSLLPHYHVPPEYPSADEYLYHLCLEGARERFGAVSEAVQRKLDYEFEVIRSKGFVSYFLVVWDYVNFARGRGMRCVARGSAAGSLVAYVLGITNVDPLRYDLLFERFLNPERLSMPDIDMDFPDDRREEVIRYVADRYGWDKVAQIVTFNTMAAKAAVRDVGRVMGMQAEADRVARLIPVGPKVSIDGSLKDVRDLKQLYDASPQIRRLVNMAKDLEGTVRSTGIHAAGVVISREALENVVPLQLRDYKDPNPWLVSQYEQAHLEELGLLKFDFLGLSNLTILMNCRKFIQQTRGIELDLDRLPDDDAKTYALLGEGETTGVFQLESGAMRTAIKDLKPTCIEDLTAMVALYRPGPMESIPQFIKSKHGEITTKYLHPALEPLLRESYGVIVYQDQVLQIAVQLAGFSWGEVDKFRKAMSKKIPAELAQYREKFVKGCQKHGIDARVAERIFAFIEPFGGYGFNKCAHGSTEIQLPDGGSMTLSAAYKNLPEQILAMWPDGQVRPHKVARIVRSGRKALLEIRTASGKSIRVTPEHRLLTTAGYVEAGEMRPGTELIIAPRRVNERQRAARRANITRLNRSLEHRTRVSTRVKAYQQARDPEALRQHMLRMHDIYPQLTRNGMAAAHERIKWLYANDPVWKARIIAKSIANSRACYDTGPGYGLCSIASNGFWCASQPEQDMCEWLIEQGVEFEMHKVLANGRICDFYFNGIYWEMDGMDRDASYFAEKYGDLPYVVVTPEDFKQVVPHHLGIPHAANGDPIVTITPWGEAMTYDVEMAPDGPLNYIANRIVSHNSHAAAYAFVAYQTAYLKANYTAEFMAATLTTEASDAKKVVAAVEECRRMGVAVLRPDVNHSDAGFTVERLPAAAAGAEVEADAPATDAADDPRWGVRFGLLAIKNVGSRPIEELLEARRNGGPFKSLADIFARTDAKNLTRGAVECLIKAGALDALGRRSQLLAALDRAMALGQQQRKMREIGQNSLFGAVVDDTGVDFVLPDVPDHPQQQILAWEKELLNLYLSAHPLAHVASVLRKRTTASTSHLNEEWAGQQVTLGGRVTEVRRLMTKRGASMAAVQLEDMQGAIEVVVFPKIFAETAEHWHEDAILLVTGSVKLRDVEPQLVCESVEEFVPSAEELNRKEYLLKIHIQRARSEALARADAEQVLVALARFPGDDRYEIYVRNGRWEARLAPVPGGGGVQFCPELMIRLEEILGPRSVEATPISSPVPARSA